MFRIAIIVASLLVSTTAFARDFMTKVFPEDFHIRLVCEDQEYKAIKTLIERNSEPRE